MEAQIREAILARAATCMPGASFCPSEVARALSTDDWRALMPGIRRVAGTLAAEGHVRVTQRGAVVDVATARGPIRIAPQSQRR